MSQCKYHTFSCILVYTIPDRWLCCLTLFVSFHIKIARYFIFVSNSLIFNMFFVFVYIFTLVYICFNNETKCLSLIRILITSHSFMHFRFSQYMSELTVVITVKLHSHAIIYMNMYIMFV